MRDKRNPGSEGKRNPGSEGKRKPGSQGKRKPGSQSKRKPGSQAKKKPGSHITYSRECKGVLENVREYEGVNLHTPKATPILGNGVLVDSQNFIERFQGSKLHGLWRSL